MDLSKFKTFNFSEGAPYMSITASGVNFNKATVLKLGKCEFAKLLINEEDKEIILMRSQEGEPGANHFYNPKRSGKSIFVRWNNKDLLNTLSRLTGWNFQRDGYRIDGIFYPQDGLILFDLKDAREMN